ncbi:MAG: HEPN domain-containing protein [Ignavibacteriaceae bacterium]|jgi:HEPN domain-containing protein
MAPNEDIIHNVKKWINYAEEDLRLAKHSLTLESGCPFRLTAYHAQQCAEKYLKALLVFHQIDFPYTHSITRLLEICSGIINTNELTEAEILTPFAITTRYPGEDEEVTKEEALDAIRIADLVKEKVILQLKLT